jgi:hypothetical protein
MSPWATVAQSDDVGGVAGEVGDDLEMNEQGLVGEDPSAGAAGAFAVGELGRRERGHHGAERFGHGVKDPSSAPGGACLAVTGGGARTESVEELVEGAAQRCEATVTMGGGCHQLGGVGSCGEETAELAQA